MIEKIKKFKEKKAVKITGFFVRTFVILLLVAFVVVVCLQRFSDNKLSFFDYRMFTVISGSMEPKYKIGDVLIAKSVDADEVKIGDAVSYLGRSGDFKDKVITHEVVGITEDPSGKKIFRTKGKTNIVEDPYVDESQLYGVVKYKVFILSVIYRIVSTQVGFFMFIVIPLIYIIGSEVISTMLEKEAKRRAQE